jgi:hypothetical protein
MMGCPTHTLTGTMTDPLSATVGTVGLLDVSVRGVRQLRKYYRSVKDAPQEIERLRDEAPALWDSLTQLGNAYFAAADNNGDDLGSHFLQWGESANTLLNKFDTILSESEHLGPQPLGTARRGRIRKFRRHVARRLQLRSQYHLASSLKKQVEILRGQMGSGLGTRTL